MPLLKVKRLTERAFIPKKNHDGEHPDSGFDLFCPCSVLLMPHAVVLVGLEIAIELPAPTDNWVFEGQIRPRSGWSRSGQWVAFGTVDSGYRGEMAITIANLTDLVVEIKAGHSLAQFVVSCVPRMFLREVNDGEELSRTDRGEKGFGSSGG